MACKLDFSPSKTWLFLGNGGPKGDKKDERKVDYNNNYIK